MSPYRVGIIGAAGYTAGELIRLLVNHPDVNIACLQSESQKGKWVGDVHMDLIGMDLEFDNKISKDLDIVFICKGHGESLKVIHDHPEMLDLMVIDLSQDFRLNGDHNFVYGLPEFFKSYIETTRHVANPGCFATAIQLGLLPAVKNDLIDGDVHISGVTGSTGAGQSFSRTSHFSWRNNNISVYKPFTHQHLNEIGESIVRVNQGFDGEVNFIPYRGNFTRGIMITSYFQSEAEEDDIIKAYRKAYENEPFSHVIEQNPDVKMVTNTNNCLVYPCKIENKVMVVSVIDNLLKGASGQAIQNMNLILGIPENTGLMLKASVF